MESFYKGKSHKDGKEESLQWGHPSMWPEMEGRVKNHSQLPSLSSRMDTDGLSTTGRGEGAAESWVGLPGHRLWTGKLSREIDLWGRGWQYWEEGKSDPQHGCSWALSWSYESQKEPLRVVLDWDKWTGLLYLLVISSLATGHFLGGGTSLRKSASYFSLGQFPITCVATNIPSSRGIASLALKRKFPPTLYKVAVVVILLLLLLFWKD